MDSSPKDLALHTLGRAIANLQKLEHQIKFLALLRPISANIEALQHQVARRIEKGQAQTLGQAIAEWKRLLTSNEAEHPCTAELFTPTIRQSISFGLAPEVIEAHVSEIEALLASRNELVHTRLVAFRWDDPSGWEVLHAELVALNERVRSQVLFLDKVVADIKDLLAAHEQFVNSEEFEKLLIENGICGREAAT